jgi:hypothetical protein
VEWVDLSTGPKGPGGPERAPDRRKFVGRNSVNVPIRALRGVIFRKPRLTTFEKNNTATAPIPQGKNQNRGCGLTTKTADF